MVLVQNETGLLIGLLYPATHLFTEHIFCLGEVLNTICFLGAMGWGSGRLRGDRPETRSGQGSEFESGHLRIKNAESLENSEAENGQNMFLKISQLQSVRPELLARS